MGDPARGAAIEIARAATKGMGVPVAEVGERTKSSRAKARELNALLRFWFSTITVVLDETKVQIFAERKPPAGKPPPAQRMVSIDRAAWVRFSPLEREPHQRYRTWEDAEIICASGRR